MQTARAPGRLKSGTLVVIAGLAMIGLAAARPMSGGAVIPMAMGVALLVFGAFLLANRRGSIAPAAFESRKWIAHYEGHVEPVYLTTLDGRFIASNPAGKDSAFPEAFTRDGAALVYRLAREAQANGIAIEDGQDGWRLNVSRLGNRMLMWRAEKVTKVLPRAPDFLSIGVPWLRLDAEDRIIASNAAARALMPRSSGRRATLPFDLPLRPDAVHLLGGSGRAVRTIILEDPSGGRDVLLMPLDQVEISGLVPDHFLEDLPVALVRLEITGRLTFANAAARQLLGDRAEPGVNIADLIEGLGRSIDERLKDTVKGRALGRSEVARGSVDDADIFLQVAFTRTVLDGMPLILAVLSDATELKTLEAQFVQSQKMQAVGQLAGGVAHDFNNLLTAINGHCDLLLMRHDVADVEHGDLMQIRQNANRAAALVRQLLAFSRKQTLRPTVINLRDTLAELTHLLNRLLTEKVTLSIVHGADLNPVRVDERQFEQVIMNLVVNARDAMPRGGEVRIVTRNVHLDADLHRDRAVILKGDYVVVEVADSGTGIPEGKLNKIFEPFYTTKQVGEGTGLGLSTVYGIIKQTGGFIFVESPPGEGARFTIYLPAHDKIEIEAVAEPVVRRGRDLTGRGLVLLVEDEDAVRSFAARALRMRGYTVVEAISGEEALEVLKDETLHVDLVLSDVIMPGLDGPGWVREAQKTRPHTKVLFMSGYAEDAFVRGDSGIPNAAFMPKPFSLSDLTERVKDHIES